MYCKQAAVALLLLAGCKQVVTQPQKTAVLRFENLGGPENDWQGRALSELLKRRFGADRIPRAASSAPGLSTERLAAINAGANRLITGYYTTANGSLEVTAFAENTGTQKLTGPVHASGNLPGVVAALAGQFGGAQDSALNGASAALPEYALASDALGAAATPHYEQAIAADPAFAPAYLGLVQSDPARAQQTLASAQLHLASFSKEDRAYLQLESATLAHDNRARSEALAGVAALDASDPDTLRALADSEMTARKPAEAAHHYKQAIALVPNNPDLRNLLAYAALFAGDEAEARAAAAEYKRLRPDDPNSLDTQGDIEFAFGHFAEAEKDYAGTPWKAARARLMAGDAAGATAILEKQPKSPITGYRAAEWLYLTGRQREGKTAMAGFAASATQPELRSLAYTQAAIWAVLAHDDAHATEWADYALKPAQPATFLFAALARFLAQPSANADLSFGGPKAAEVRQLAVGLKLLQMRQFTEALPVWKRIYETTTVNDAAPMYLYGWALLETGHKAEAAPLLRLNPIPIAGIAPSLEAFYVPAVFEWRKASLRQ